MNGEFERPCEFDHAYAEVAKKHDPFLGEYKIKRGPSGQDLVLVKEYQTTSKSQAITVLNSLAQRKEIRVPNLLQLRDFSCKDESHFCGTFYHYNSYYEYYDLNLKKFKERQGSMQTGFDELLLTKFMYQMVRPRLTSDRHFGRARETKHRAR